MVAFRPYRSDLDGLPGRLRWRDDRLSREVERNTQYICVFHVEQALLVEIVRLAAQRAAYDLLAKKLCAEGSHAEDMCDGLGIPAFGQHGNRHDAPDGPAKAAFFSNSVHDFTKQVLIGNVLGLTAVTGTFDYFPAETLDLVGSHVAKVLIERVAGLELLTVDQECMGPAKRVVVLIKISEELKASVLKFGRAILVFLIKA